MRKPPKKIAFPFYLLLITGLILSLLWWQGIRFNVSESMPIGVYHLVDKPVERGRWVSVCLPSALSKFALEREYLPKGVCPNGTQPLLKVVVAMPGDTVELIQGALIVNGHHQLLSATKNHDETQRALPSLARGTYFTPPNEVWLLGHRAPNSWDSRYFGAISMHHIQAVAEKISLTGATS